MNDKEITTKSSQKKWMSDVLSNEEFVIELEKKNLLPYFGMTETVLEKIKSPSLENLCKAIKTIPLPYEVLISQNPIENIAMYLTAQEFKKQNNQMLKLPEQTKELVAGIRNFYWKNKDFEDLYSVLDYPLRVLPEDFHQKRLESLPKQILIDLEQAIYSPCTAPSEIKYTRGQAINEISECLYRIYKQNNQF